MMDSEDDSAPLLQTNSISQSSSRSSVLEVGLEEQPNQQATYFQRPNGGSIHSPAGIFPNQWQTQTQRSNSSLITLAADKKMSDPRRTFCLFVTFDFLITVILWLIECGTQDDYFFNQLTDQFVHYGIHSSLADVVVLALARFIFLQLTYALFRVRHWWPVAISTAISNACLILKIFAVFTAKPEPERLNLATTVLLLLVDFVLTWIEVWFIDFKVIPAELKMAQKTVQAFMQQSYQVGMSSEHSMRGRFPHYGAMSASEGAGYYSPAASAPPSEGGRTGVESMYYSISGYQKSSSHFSQQLSAQDSNLVNFGKDALSKLWSFYQCDSIWNQEKALPNGDTVYSTENKEYGKTFRIDANIAGLSPDVIYREIILKAEEMPVWNKSIADVKVLRKIGEQTFITLEVSSPAAMGLIASREFITVRRIEKCGDCYVSAGISTDQCDDIIPKSNYVR
ncbi:unnamed protein product [Clavelina lepadiformis]|uniref:StAR-related lipid transfer protein 3 n=1 Tax=Clavelina lepadiformis TaxID=159417 RepID=A0ABP0EX21_CLALP